MQKKEQYRRAIKVGKKHTNGSVIGKVKIHQHGDETEDDCIVIES